MFQRTHSQNEVYSRWLAKRGIKLPPASPHLATARAVWEQVLWADAVLPVVRLLGSHCPHWQVTEALTRICQALS